jgi:hypothetical protein
MDLIKIKENGNHVTPLHAHNSLRAAREMSTPCQNL